MTLTWIDARVTAGTKEDLVLAGRALGIVPASADAAERVKALLAHPDLEVRRAALLSAASRPWPTLVGALLGNFLDAGVHHETREAVAALGDVATPALSELLGGAKGYRARGLAAGTLARIGTPAAVRPLHELVRNSDPQLRHLGLRALARVRVRTGSPVLARAIVHRLFLRELREYRSHMDPALALADHAAPAVRLLAESHRESADMALERAVQALACWYEPAPLAGVLDRLRSSGTKFAAPALEYLEHILPRATFLPVRRLFEAPTEVELATATPTSAWIEAAWRSDDTWLRACAVRASGFVEAVDPGMFRSAQDPDARVRAELEALAAATC